jgi:hypothetical protein
MNLTSTENAQTSTCVVYDLETGDVLHTHSIISLPGAEVPTEDELAAEAKSMVHKTYTTDHAPKLAVLQLGADETAHLVGRVRVDLKQLCLIPVDTESTVESNS